MKEINRLKYRGPIIGVSLAAISAFLIIILQPVTVQRDYRNAIERKRANIGYFMANSPQSPIPDEERVGLVQLDYYDVDPSFKTSAYLERIPGEEIIEVPTSADTFDRFVRYATLRFTLRGKEFTLEVWRPIEGKVSNRLFAAFTDQTSGGETYGGGRYLDLYESDDSQVTLDFNLAYNPYCVYDPSYVCPLAPPGNRLDIEILAGEKMYYRL